MDTCHSRSLHLFSAFSSLEATSCTSSSAAAARLACAICDAAAVAAAAAASDASLPASRPAGRRLAVAGRRPLSSPAPAPRAPRAGLRGFEVGDERFQQGWDVGVGVAASHHSRARGTRLRGGVLL